MSDILRDEGSYRKGLVLGFTVAETILLLLFALLLALSLLLSSQKSEMEKLKDGIEKLRKDVTPILRDPDRASGIAALMDSGATVTGGDVNAFNDLFRELVVGGGNIHDKIAAMKNLLSHLTQQGILGKGEPGRLSNELGKTIQLNRAIDQFAPDFFKEIDNNPQRAVSDLRQALEFKKALDQSSMISGVTDFQKLLTERASELANCRNQNEYLRRQLEECKGTGKGSSYPPCWTNEGGRIRYIFNIAITDIGFIVKPTDFGDYQESTSKLPVEQIILNREVNPDQFVRMTLPLFRWSQGEECRFFVRLFDMTGPREKDIYKKRRKTVEGHFLILPVDGGF